MQIEWPKQAYSVTIQEAQRGRGTRAQRQSETTVILFLGIATGSRQELQTRKDDAQSADGLFTKSSKVRGYQTNRIHQTGS